MIHKQGPIHHGSIFKVPYSSNLIACDYQAAGPAGGRQLCFWYAFDPNTATTHEEVEVEFAVVGTGWEFDLEGWAHLRTVFDGPFVWHVYVREKSDE